MAKIDYYKLLTTKKDDYLFNLFDIENFNKETSRLRFFFNHIRRSDKSIRGNIFEFGTYQGRSLLATALLLKKIKSNKIIYAFDSFTGLSKYTKYDDVEYLKYDDAVYLKHLIAKNIKEINLEKKINRRNISTSNEFKNRKKNILLKKIRILKLDNIKIIEGLFQKTVPKFFANYDQKISAVNMDCDLYDSYKTVLPVIYKKLEKGGYIHIDEYFSIKYPGCRIAVDEFCKENKVRIKKNKSFDWEFDRYFIKK